MKKDFTTEYPELQRFIACYSALDKANLATLDSLYAKEVVFEDPAHRIEGYANLQRYFAALYANLNQCQFEMKDAIMVENTAYLRWTMQLSHPKLAQGKLREIAGCTYLKFDQQRVVYHRDYFDLGAMLYEAVPVLGSIIQAIKKRLGQ